MQTNPTQEPDGGSAKANGGSRSLERVVRRRRWMSKWYPRIMIAGGVLICLEGIAGTFYGVLVGPILAIGGLVIAGLGAANYAIQPPNAEVSDRTEF